MGSTVVSWTNTLSLAKGSNVHVFVNAVCECLDCCYYSSFLTTGNLKAVAFVRMAMFMVGTIRFLLLSGGV